LHIETNLSPWHTLTVPRRPRRKGGTLKDGERRQLAYASRRAGKPPKVPEPTGTALVLCDGGSRGNPGPAAVAAVLFAADGTELARRVERIGRAGAADAEYRALALALDLAAAHGADPIEVRSDSQLAIAALDGSGDERFTEIRWRWHPRAENEVADALVRAALWGE
jgi:ribonuclease HI